MIANASPIVARVRFLLSDANKLLQHMPADTRREIIDQCLPEPIPANPETFYRHSPSVKVRIFPGRRGNRLYWYYAYKIGEANYKSYICAASLPHHEIEQAIADVCAHAEKLNQAAPPAEVQPTLF